MKSKNRFAISLVFTLMALTALIVLPVSALADSTQNSGAVLQPDGSVKASITGEAAVNGNSGFLLGYGLTLDPDFSGHIAQIGNTTFGYTHPSFDYSTTNRFLGSTSSIQFDANDLAQVIRQKYSTKLIGIGVSGTASAGDVSYKQDQDFTLNTGLNGMKFDLVKGDATAKDFLGIVGLDLCASAAPLGIVAGTYTNRSDIDSEFSACLKAKVDGLGSFELKDQAHTDLQREGGNEVSLSAADLTFLPKDTVVTAYFEQEDGNGSSYGQGGADFTFKFGGSDQPPQSTSASAATTPAPTAAAAPGGNAPTVAPQSTTAPVANN